MSTVRGWTEDDIVRREQVFEALLAKAVRMSLRPLSAQLNRTLAAAGGPTLSFEPDPGTPRLPTGATTVVTATWTHYVDSELFPYLAQTFVDSAAAIRAGTEAALDVSVPPVTESFALQYLAAASNRLVGVGDLVWSQVRDQLVEGYANGETTHQLAARVRDVAGFTEGRAVTVARTEVVGAANVGALAQLKIAGFTDEEASKRWIATEDERTRPAHHLADGQTVPLSQPFIVGGEGLQVPGDPRGRADNVINCRCTFEVVFAEDITTAAGFIKRWLEKLHPRDRATGRFAEKDTPKVSAPAAPKMIKYIPAKPKTEFHILPKSQRGKSGDVMYSPGMYGRYGAAGVMIRTQDPQGGPDRFLVVQRSTGKYNKWKWQLPGGALDEKETPEQGAARESFEEVGATPDVLARLRKVGEHKVTLPVQGKPPWSYTNIAVDIDKPFKPVIDYGELGAARWLTADQLHEMRGRGRLVAPFAEHLDTILAKFDAKPMIAAVTKKAMHAAEQAWDEFKHPRAPKGAGHGHGGEFVKKGVGVGQVQALKPIKINTKTVYSTKYAHNAVVAQRVTKHGAYQELRWNDINEKFELWSDFGGGKGSDLKLGQALGKGQTYQQFGKDDTYGWVEAPPKKSLQEMFKKPDLMEWEKSLLPQGNAPEAPPAEPKKKFQTPDSLLYATQADINVYFQELTKEKWDSLTTKERNTLLSISYTENIKGNNIPGKKIDNIIASQIQIGYEVKPWFKDPANLPKMTTKEINSFFNDLTEDEYNGFTPEEKKTVSDIVKIEGQSDNIVPAEKISGFSTGHVDYLAAEIYDLTTDELKTWMYDNLYPDSYDEMSDEEKNYLWQVVLEHGPQAVSIFNEQTNGGQGTAGLPLDENTGFYDEPTPTAQVNKNIKEMSGPQFVDFMSKLLPAQWQHLTADEKKTLKDKALDIQTNPQSKGFGPNDQSYLTPYSQVLDLESVSTSIDEGLTDLGKMLTNPVKKSLSDMSQGEFLNWMHGNVDKTSYMFMSEDEQKNLWAAAKKHGVVSQLNDVIYGVSVAQEVAKMKKPSVSVPGTGTTSAYNTDHVKTAASIGTPNTDAFNFAPLSVQNAHKLQQDMLKKAGKSDWTSVEKAAVAGYTTSVGYQTTNAVMRNDTERMKMFSPAQLQQGVERAVHLQNAMTPLTLDVQLHRGTGAQAFGFKGTDVSHDELAQLVGSTISDKGFLSTSVIPPTEAGVGFDYATKKPIKMIIQAPAGTPGVYVSSVTPGYSHENEFVLAAGTTLRIDSVSGATPADKAKYGSSIKHLVVATVVPTPDVSAKHVVPPAPAAVIPPVNAPKLNLAKPGKPLKITTGIIYPKKGSEYSAGQVVAVKYRLDGAVEQLFWSGSNKKYGHRISSKDKTSWGPPSYYGKGEAWDAFGKSEAYSKGWTLPPAGANVAQDVDALPGEVKPSISGNPSSVTIQHTAVTAEVKTPKLTAVAIQKQYGIVPQLPPSAVPEFYGSFKNGSGVNITLNSAGSGIFTSLALAVAKHNEKYKNDPESQLNLLQGVKLIDAKSTPKDKTNAGLYEAKIVAWLQTPSGKKNAQTWIDQAQETAKKPPVQATSTWGGGTTFGGTPINVGDIKTPGEIGTPKTDITKFGNITHLTASKMNDEMRAKHGAWTHEQTSTIANYTGSGSGSINSALRSGTASPGMLKKIATLQSAMAPVPRSFTVHRGTDGVGDLIPPHISFEELQKLVGESVIDKGFLSTSVGNTAAFSSKKYLLEVDIPEGTPGAYVANHSSVGQAEREFLIAAGTKYKILGVSKMSQYQYKIKMQVVP